MGRRFWLPLEGKALGFCGGIALLPAAAKPRQSINNGCKTRKKRADVAKRRTNPRRDNKILNKPAGKSSCVRPEKDVV